MERLDAVICESDRQDALMEKFELGDVEEKLVQRGHAALHLLLEAYEYARGLRRNGWDFAVEIQGLQERGLTNSDLRWLVCMDYLEQAQETVPDDEVQRAFRHEGSLTFSDKSCFVLTEIGVDFARIAVDRPVARSQRVPDQQDEKHHNGNGKVKALVPKWDRDRQELRLGDSIVKQFKVPAPNQEMILAVFQEEGWPVRIDDPLPPHPELDPKRRLHDTINSLNRNQKNPVVRFLGDGSGLGVRWDLVPAREVAPNGKDSDD